MAEFYSRPANIFYSVNEGGQTTDDTDLPPDDTIEIDLGYSDDHKLFPYTLQEIQVSYVGDEGLLQVAVGAPFTVGGVQIPCKVVRAHAPVQQKVVTYAFARQFVPPIIPPPETADVNLALLRHTRIFWGYREIAPGVQLYIRVGEYVYAVRVPLTTADTMPTCRAPAYVAGLGAETAQPSEYDSSLVG